MAEKAKSILDSIDGLHSAAQSIGSVLAEATLNQPIEERARIEGSRFTGLRPTSGTLA